MEGRSGENRPPVSNGIKNIAIVKALQIAWVMNTNEPLYLKKSSRPSNKISMKEPMYKVIVESIPDIIAKNGFANINTKNNQTMNWDFRYNSAFSKCFLGIK